MLEAGFPNLFFLLFDALIESVQCFPFFKDSVEKPFPFRFPCLFFGISVGLSGAFDIGKLEE